MSPIVLSDPSFYPFFRGNIRRQTVEVEVLSLICRNAEWDVLLVKQIFRTVQIKTNPFNSL